MGATLVRGLLAWWMFRIFFNFFCSGEGKGESEAPGGGGGGDFLWKIPGGGGVSVWVGAEGRGAGWVFAETRGGGLNIFFRGRNAHQVRHRTPRPHSRIRLALPSSGVDLASIPHPNRVKSGNRCRIDVKSMPNRPLRREGRGGFEGGVWGSYA